MEVVNPRSEITAIEPAKSPACDGVTAETVTVSLLPGGNRRAFGWTEPNGT